MLTWLKKHQKNAVACAQYARRRVTKLEKNALDKVLHKSEQTLVKAFRREVAPFLQEKHIAQTCKDCLDGLIDKIIKSATNGVDKIDMNFLSDSSTNTDSQVPILQSPNDSTADDLRQVPILQSPNVLKSLTRCRDLTWNERACLIFVHLSNLLPHLKGPSRTEKIARAGGVEAITIKNGYKSLGSVLANTFGSGTASLKTSPGAR